MASQTYHHNKKTGVTYVYSVESYWDKEKKRPANKQVCLGKLDKEALPQIDLAMLFGQNSHLPAIIVVCPATSLMWRR
jgi:hypothetical protein